MRLTDTLKTISLGGKIMTLSDLQNILGERILKLTDETLSSEQRKQEIEISQTISSLAKQMINNADVVLRTDKLISTGELKNSKIKDMI